MTIHPAPTAVTVEDEAAAASESTAPTAEAGPAGIVQAGRAGIVQPGTVGTLQAGPVGTLQPGTVGTLQPGPVPGLDPGMAASAALGFSRPVGPRAWSPAATWTVRAIGLAGLVAAALTVWLGLWVTPPSTNMGDLVRLVYIHPPIAWVALYLAFGTLGLGSILWLWPRTRNLVWDRVAAAGAEVGMVFTALTLVTGSIWGRPTWGVWWAWDARLTSTALLLVLLLGYLALRRVPADDDTRARRSAVAGLVALVDVPIVYFSVSWWHTLHETSNMQIHGLMAGTMLLGFAAFSLLFAWMLATALRIQTLRAYLDEIELHAALAERRAEGSGPAAPAGPVGGAAPVGPLGSAGPLGSVGPVGPVGPVGSAGPLGPVGPAGPAGPVNGDVPVMTAGSEGGAR